VAKILRPLLLFSAFMALLVLVAGAVQTSATIWAGLDPAHQGFAQSVVLAKAHRDAGSLLLVLILVCAGAGWKSDERVLCWLTLTALGAGVFEALSALIGPLQLSSYRAVLHAVCGHIIVACLATATVVVFTASRSKEPVVCITDGFPLVSLAAWIPPLVLTQVAMGALYRHNLWGVLPHMAGAMAVAFLLVSEGVILLQKEPEHRLLHRAAVWAIAIVLAQISLGIADFLVRLLDFEDSSVWLGLSIAHVTVASLVFTASICLALSVRAYVGTPITRN
jgi:heme A synthase